MPLLQVRNVPEDTRRVLKARAAAGGESLNSYLLRLIEQDAARPTVAEVLDRVTRRSERATASSVQALHDARAERDSQLADRSAL